MTKTLQTDLEKRLEDIRFAEEYGSSIAKAEIAVTVAQARRSKGITQQELAGKLGITQAYIAKLEGGDSNPTVSKVGKILAHMGLKLTTAISDLSSSIESKEVSVLSLNANQTFFSFNSLCALSNKNVGAAVVGASWIPRIGSGSIIINGVSEQFAICIGTDNVAEDSTDVLWQAPKEGNKMTTLDMKGGR